MIRKHTEVEIKFLVADPAQLERQLLDLGFRQTTAPTFERNTLYDTPIGTLRGKREVLRIRLYGDRWTVTHKSKGSTGRHKSRIEHETSLTDGERMDSILRALGYQPAFVYEKFRSQWTDSHGEIVVDRTPIGNVAEIEGSPRWIDQTARKLGIRRDQYITDSYVELFFAWKRRTRSSALHMTFRECGTRKPRLPRRIP